MATAQPKAKSTTRKRTTRTQEKRAAEPVHEYHGGFNEDGTLLDAPESRPGFVQRWVRTKLEGHDDPGNLVRRLNQGWRPRSADTIPKGFFAPTISHGEYGNVIGTHDMLLMERPEDLHQKYTDKVKEDTKNLERAVKANLGQTHNPNQQGFTRPQMETQTSVTKGRPAPVADD